MTDVRIPANGPQASGNDVADAALDARCQKREAVVRRVCAVMGWDYHQSPVWTGLRKVALAEAVPVGLDKLEEIMDRLDEANRKANAAQTLSSNQRQMIDQAEVEKGALQIRVDEAVAALDRLADLLADSEELPVGQTDAVRLIDEIIAALAARRREPGVMHAADAKPPITTTEVQGITVLACRTKYGRQPKCYANLAQAERAAQALRLAGQPCVVRRWPRPFYVVLK
jgi:hypothetical protein